MKLLVIEDSPEVQRRLCRLLTAIPDTSVAASTSLGAGMEQLRREPPDIVILDLQLSDGDGMDLLITAKRDYPAIRVFVLSNHVFRRQLCMAAGADRFFDKSMEFGALLDAIKGLAN